MSIALNPGNSFIAVWGVTQRSFQLNDSLLFTPFILDVICFVVTAISQPNLVINLN